MRAPRTPLAALGFHLASGAWFGGCSVLLYRAWAIATEPPPKAELVAAVAAALLAALSVAALVSMLGWRPLAPIRTRATTATYLQALFASLLLATGAAGLSATGRRALVAFSAGAAAWLACLGLNLLPRVWASSEGLIDHLGRRVRFKRMEWFTLARIAGPTPRSRLVIGSGQRVLLTERLIGTDERGVHELLVQHGVKERTS